MATVIFLAQVLFNLWVQSVVPATPGLPRWIDFVMQMGWIMGTYLSLTLIAISPLVRRFCSEAFAEQFAAAHGLQLPIVVIGVGLWMVLRLIGMV